MPSPTRPCSESQLGLSRAARDFADELVRLHGGVVHPQLLDSIEGEPLCRLDDFDDGLTTVSFRQHQLPERYLGALLGFRLAQLLSAGLIDAELVRRRLLVHEPVVEGTGPDTIHTLTLTDAGAIVGYVAMIGAPDLAARALDAPGRALFPVEIAHDVDLLAGFAAPGLTTCNAYEVKRFMRDRSLPRGPQRDRVSWHLILAAGRVILAHPEIRILLGDSGERGALRHLRLIGLDLVVLEGRAPARPRTELMWPSYFLPGERLAKPFVGAVPDDAYAYADAVEAALRIPSDAHWQRAAVAKLVELHHMTGRLPGLGPV